MLCGQWGYVRFGGSAVRYGGGMAVDCGLWLAIVGSGASQHRQVPRVRTSTTSVKIWPPSRRTASREGADESERVEEREGERVEEREGERVEEREEEGPPAGSVEESCLWASSSLARAVYTLSRTLEGSGRALLLSSRTSMARSCGRWLKSVGVLAWVSMARRALWAVLEEYGSVFAWVVASSG